MRTRILKFVASRKYLFAWGILLVVISSVASWSLVPVRPLRSLRSDYLQVPCRFTGNDQYLFTVGFQDDLGKVILRWEIASGKCDTYFVPPKPNPGVTTQPLTASIGWGWRFAKDLPVSPSGTHLVFAGTNPVTNRVAVDVWDLDKGKPTLRIDAVQLYRITHSPDSKWIALDVKQERDLTPTVRLFRTSDAREVNLALPQKYPFLSWAKFSPQSKYVAVQKVGPLQPNRTVPDFPVGTSDVWRLEGDEPKKLFELEGSVLGFSDDESRMVSWQTKIASIHSLPDGKVISTHPLITDRNGGLPASFHDSNNLVRMFKWGQGDRTGSMQVWDLNSKTGEWNTVDKGKHVDVISTHRKSLNLLWAFDSTPRFISSVPNEMIDLDNRGSMTYYPRASTVVRCSDSGRLLLLQTFQRSWLAPLKEFLEKSWPKMAERIPGTFRACKMFDAEQGRLSERMTGHFELAVFSKDESLLATSELAGGSQVINIWKTTAKRSVVEIMMWAAIPVGAVSLLAWLLRSFNRWRRGAVVMTGDKAQTPNQPVNA